MHKRERLEKTIAGEATDRIPVALWRHFPGDDQRASDLALALINFQKQWDFDFIKVTPASSYCLVDYGVQDRWVGSIEGTREYAKRVIQETIDWTQLRRLDPAKGSLGIQADVLHHLKDAYGIDVPYIQTIYSPLAQAENLVGPDHLLRHLRQAPDRLTTGLNTITDNILRYLDVIREAGVAGIFYAIQHASYDMMSEAEYREFGRPYDLRILQALPQAWWFNMIHLHGNAPMFNVVADYPVQSINWHDRETELSLSQGKIAFQGAVCGGLARWNSVYLGTPGTVREQAVEAIEQTKGRRFILSTGCGIMTNTPQANIRTVREIVEQVKMV